MGRRLAAVLLLLGLASSPARTDEGKEGDGADGPTPAQLLERADRAIYVFAESGAKRLEGRLVIPGTALGRLEVEFTWKAPEKEGAAATLRVKAAESVPEAYRPLAVKEATRALESLVIGRPLARIADEARLSVETRRERPVLLVEYTSGPLKGSKGSFTFDPESDLPRTQVLETPGGATVTDTFRFEKEGDRHRLAGIDRRTRNPAGRENAEAMEIEWVSAKGIAVPWRIRQKGQLVGAGQFHLEGLVLDGTRLVTPAEVEERTK